ncbi:PREDICTED: F-box protein At4g22280-like [Ipomoea nil]|uniref:F-box protein At4g22280-like n=1 Tax=Ipomoea nil TaxID=35883 RepID=UPI0009019F98|nr:PREDICTED: F-box protein At4g22280-like [Ipomoea nil]
MLHCFSKPTSLSLSLCQIAYPFHLLPPPFPLPRKLFSSPCTVPITVMILREMEDIMSSFKRRQKVSEVVKIDDGEDKISQLPDGILHHILSFLPTSNAVATCILSTRWKNLWTIRNNLDFDDSLLYSSPFFDYKVTCFMHFVQRVLELRNASTIEKFCLSCRVCFSASHVCTWLSSAIKNNVQELDLCLFAEEPFSLPPCVFYSKSLLVLKLQMTCILELPDSISFPCLRTLHLRLVTFPDDSSTQRLFSGCPVLQELAVLDCEWIHLKSVSISIPSLKSLTIDDLPYFGSSDDLNGCEIRIDSSNLCFLKYSGYLSNEIYLYNLSSRVDASIHIAVLCEKRNQIAFRAVNLFRGLNNVSSVRISSGAIKSLFSADDVLDRLPVFQNLTHLELSKELENQTVGALMELLRRLPKLESLDFSQGLDPCKPSGENDWKLKAIPTCFFSSLKTVNYCNFHAKETEICFLKLLLNIAIILEEMNIFCSKSFLEDPKKHKEVRNHLHTPPKGSAHCAIKFFEV